MPHVFLWFAYLILLIKSAMLDFSHGVWLTRRACFLLLFTDRNRAETGCLCQTALIMLSLFKIHTCSHLFSTSFPSLMLYEPYLPTAALRFVILEIPPSLSSVTCFKQLFYKHQPHAGHKRTGLVNEKWQNSQLSKGQRSGKVNLCHF